jgi:uncharacterized membrane protein
MNKREFLVRLEESLRGISGREVSERIEFYSEAIDDRIEEGLSEEEAVLAVGSVEKIAEQIKQELLQGKNAKKNKRGRKMKAWEIALLAIGSPIWISLLAAAFAVIFAVYVSAWSVIISLWAVFGSLLGGAVGGFVSGIVVMLFQNVPAGIILISLALICAGLAILTFYGCRETTKGIISLTKMLFRGINNAVKRRKEDNE